MPQAFGKFIDNFTLDCVCKECNAYFGNNLELFLARDTIEALLRLQYGLKPLESVENLRRDRLRISFGTEGDWQGALGEFIFEDGEPVVGPIAQVGFAKKGEPGWIYLTEHELADSGRSIPDNVDPDEDIKMVAPNEQVEKRLINLLAKKGIKFQKKRDLPPPPCDTGQHPVDINVRIDRIIQRCIAKIAFNDLTWVTGPDFALLPDFDVIRSYIRDGKLPHLPLVDVTQETVLADESPNRRQTNGHMITLAWSASTPLVEGQVSLFNANKYRIRLAQNFSGVWRDIRSGHHFDIIDRRITPLLATSLSPGWGPRRSL